MKKALLIVVAVLAVAFFIGNADAVRQFGVTLMTGKPLPLVVAVIVMVVRYLVQAQSYNASFDTVGFKTGFWHNVKLIFSLVFINTFCLFSGATGVAFIIDDAHRKGADGGTASSGAILTQIGYFAALLIISAIGAVVMLASGGRNVLFLTCTVLVVAILLVLSSFFLVGHYKPELLHRIFGVVDRAVRWFMNLIKRELKEGWGDELASSFVRSAGILAGNPKGVFVSLALATVSALFNMACLIAIGFAYGYDQIVPLVLAFSMAAVSIQVSPTPQGVGVTEVVITSVLTGSGASVADAAAIALVYRGIMLWLPFLMGAVLLSQTGFFKGSKARSEENRRTDIGWISGVIMAILGLTNIALALFSKRLLPYAMLTQFVDLTTLGIGVDVLHVVGGVALVVLAVGLVKRVNEAWFVSVVVLVALGVVEFYFGVVQVPVFCLAFGLWLVFQRRAFDKAGPLLAHVLRRRGGTASP